MDQSQANHQSIHEPQDQLTKQCPVCLDFKSKTIQTECSHTFCVKCIFEWILCCVEEKDGINCPLCRQFIRLKYLKWE